MVVVPAMVVVPVVVLVPAVVAVVSRKLLVSLGRLNAILWSFAVNYSSKALFVIGNYLKPPNLVHSIPGSPTKP